VNKSCPQLDSITDREPNLSGERVAILVNDMLNDFINGALRSDRASKIISSIKDLTSVARKKVFPVLFVRARDY